MILAVIAVGCRPGDPMSTAGIQSKRRFPQDRNRPVAMAHDTVVLPLGRTAVGIGDRVVVASDAHEWASREREVSSDFEKKQILARTSDSTRIFDSYATLTMATLLLQSS
jgi:hypothetical protein